MFNYLFIYAKVIPKVKTTETQLTFVTAVGRKIQEIGKKPRRQQQESQELCELPVEDLNNKEELEVVGFDS